MTAFGRGEIKTGMTDIGRKAAFTDGVANGHF